MKLSWTLLIPALLGGLAHAAPLTFALKPEQSPVTFLATGKPGFLKIRGEGAQASGAATLDGQTLAGRFEVKLDAFKTGIDLRDEHMKTKYLKVGEFPTATLTLAPTTLPSATGKVEVPFNGTLTIKGTEKPVSGTLEAALSPTEATGTAKMTIKLTDYPIDVPTYLGVTVAESVDVEVAFVAAAGAATARH
jgi:polyisoprenoid-binding protein YceI